MPHIPYRRSNLRTTETWRQDYHRPQSSYGYANYSQPCHEPWFDNRDFGGYRQQNSKSVGYQPYSKSVGYQPYYPPLEYARPPIHQPSGHGMSLSRFVEQSSEFKQENTDKRSLVGYNRVLSSGIQPLPQLIRGHSASLDHPLPSLSVSTPPSSSSISALIEKPRDK